MAASVDLVAKRGLAITDLNGKLRRGSSRRRGVDWHESRHAGHGDFFLSCATPHPGPIVPMPSCFPSRPRQ
jgi:hypothetical protein